MNTKTRKMQAKIERAVGKGVATERSGEKGAMKGKGDKDLFDKELKGEL